MDAIRLSLHTSWDLLNGPNENPSNVDDLQVHVTRKTFSNEMAVFTSEGRPLYISCIFIHDRINTFPIYKYSHCVNISLMTVK